MAPKIPTSHCSLGSDSDWRIHPGVGRFTAAGSSPLVLWLDQQRSWTEKNTANSTSAHAPAPLQLGRVGLLMPLLCLDTGEAFFLHQCGIWWMQLFSFILHSRLNCISAGTCPVLINIKLPDHLFELEQFLTTNSPESQISEWLVAGWERWMLGELNDSWPDSFTMVRVVGMSQLRFLWQNLSLKRF